MTAPIQAADSGSTAINSGTAWTSGLAIPAGSLLVVAIEDTVAAGTTGDVASVVSTGDTWHKASALGNSTIGSDNEIWYCLNAAAAASKAITVTTTSGSGYKILLQQWQTYWNKFISGATNSSAGSSAVTDPQTVVTRQLAVVFQNDNSSVSSASSAPWSFYNSGAQFSWANGVDVGSAVLPTANASFGPTWNLSSSAAWLAVGAVFGSTQGLLPILGSI